jgi:hypothetical protein
MTDVLVAVLSVGGTVVGSLGGILAANKLTNFRIECLEKKVDKHNCLVERMFIVEGRLDKLNDLCDEKFKVANHRIEDLEKAE